MSKLKKRERERKKESKYKYKYIPKSVLAVKHDGVEVTVITGFDDVAQPCFIARNDCCMHSA